jgi:hypothetical protein
MCSQEREEMLDKIEDLLSAIKADYVKWTTRNGTKELNEINKEMIEDFNESLAYTVGAKYVKITKGGSVWGFIVKGEDDKKFKKGDILKPASWATPARNAARGNILEGGYAISWTGPNYLR